MKHWYTPSWLWSMMLKIREPFSAVVQFLQLTALIISRFLPLAQRTNPPVPFDGLQSNLAEDPILAVILFGVTMTPVKKARTMTLLYSQLMINYTKYYHNRDHNNTMGVGNSNKKQKQATLNMQPLTGRIALLHLQS